MRRIGAGNPPLHRFRIGLEFVDLRAPRRGRHDRPARRHGTCARRAARPSRRGRRGSRRLVRDLERQGLAGERAGRGDPDCGPHRATRGVPRGRVSGRRGRGARELARKRRGRQFDPALCALVCDDADDPRGARDGADVGRSDRGRAGARGRAHRASRSTGRSRRSPPSSTSSPRSCSATRRPSPSSPPRRPPSTGCSSRRADAAARRTRPRPRTARHLELDLGQARAARSRASGSGCGCSRTSPSACSSNRRRSRRWARSPCSSASGSTAPAIRAGSRAPRSPARADPRRRRRLPGDARAAPVPGCVTADGGRRPAPRRGRGRGGSTLTRSRPCSVPPATGSRGAGAGRPASPRARSRCSGCSRAGYSNKEIARRLVISPKTVGNHVEHIYAKIDASTARRREPVRHAARPAPRGGVRRCGAALTALKMGRTPHESAAATLLRFA